MSCKLQIYFLTLEYILSHKLIYIWKQSITVVIYNEMIHHFLRLFLLQGLVVANTNGKITGLIICFENKRRHPHPTPLFKNIYFGKLKTSFFVTLTCMQTCMDLVNTTPLLYLVTHWKPTSSTTSLSEWFSLTGSWQIQAGNGESRVPWDFFWLAPGSGAGKSHPW